MPKTANKARGEVALPEAFGKGVFIRFDIDAMERMETEYGDDWIDVIIEKTGRASIPTFRTVIGNTLVEPDDAFDYSPLSGSASEARATILDAISLAIYSRTVEEQAEHQSREDEKEIAGKLEKMGQDPQMAPAVLLLQSLGVLGTGSASDPMSAGASPQEK